MAGLKQSQHGRNHCYVLFGTRSECSVVNFDPLTSFCRGGCTSQKIIGQGVVAEQHMFHSVFAVSWGMAAVVARRERAEFEVAAPKTNGSGHNDSLETELLEFAVHDSISVLHDILSAHLEIHSVHQIEMR